MRALDWIVRLVAAAVLLQTLLGDGGLLFALACLVLLCSLATIFIHRSELRFI